MKIDKNKTNNQMIDTESYSYDDVNSVDNFLSTKIDNLQF